VPAPVGPTVPLLVYVMQLERICAATVIVPQAPIVMTVEPVVPVIFHDVAATGVEDGKDVPVDDGADIELCLHVNRRLVPTDIDRPVDPDSVAARVLSVVSVSVHVAKPVVHVPLAPATGT